MTGYESKRAMARDKLLELAQDGMSMHSHDAPEYIVCEALIEALAQPAQESASVTYKGVADAMNELRKGTLEQKQIAKEMGNKKLYTAPPQRTWIGLTDEDCKEIEDMPDTFDQGVAWCMAKLKRKNT